MKFIGFINEAANTAYRTETMACVGIVASDLDMKFINIIAELERSKQIKEDPIEYEGTAQKALKRIQSIIEKDFDWHPKGYSYIKSIESDNWTEIIRMCKIVRGMNDFVNDKVKPVIANPAFIHGSITDYRKAEKDFIGNSKGGKENTVDCVILNANKIYNFFDSIEKNGVTSYPEESKGYIVTGDYTYFQISLKESMNAQQGKFTTPAKSMQLLPLDAKGKNVDIKGEIEPILRRFGKRDMSEGLVDTLKNIWSWLTSKIKSITQKLTIEAKKTLYVEPTKQDYLKVLSFYKNENISEAVDDILFVSKSGKNITDPFTKKAIISITHKPSIMIDEINRKLQVAINKAKNNDIVFVINKLKPISKLTGSSEEIIQTCFALVCNYITAEFLINFISRASDMGDVIKNLIASMKFGNTQLPMWKVFGYGTPYQYMGTYEIYVKQYPDLTVDPLGIKTHPNTSKKYGYEQYYVFNIFILDNLNNKEKEYVLARSGSYSSSHIAFGLEGTTLVGPYPIETKMIDIIKVDN